MTSPNVRPIVGPAPTFGMSDVQKAQLAAEAAQAAQTVANPAPPVAPAGSSKPSLEHLQAQFLTRRAKPVSFGSATPTASGNTHLFNDITTGHEGVSTPELWKRLVQGAQANSEVAKHFTFTSPQVVNELLTAADIQPGERVLEPSAGTGSIAIPAALKTDQVYAIEQYSVLQELLKRGAIRYDMSKLDADLIAKIKANHPRLTLLPDSDFLQMAQPSSNDERYDKIILSPPHGGPEMDHVKKAYDMLKPGGSVLALLPGYLFSLTTPQLQRTATSFRGADGRSRSVAQFEAFRKWFDAHHGLNSAIYIGEGGQAISKKHRVRSLPFVQYRIGEQGEVIENDEKLLNTVLIRVTKPVNACLPLNLDVETPAEQAPVAQDNVVPIRTEPKRVANA